MQHLSIRLLGRPQVLLDGKPVRFPTRKALALLAYLVAADEAQSRETLMALLWPDSATASAQASLRSALNRLRMALGDAGGMVIATLDAMSIDPAADFDLDLRAVSAAAAAIRDTSRPPPPALLQTAIDSYRGEFLSAFIIGDAPDYNYWGLVQRERWHHQLALILENLTQFYLKRLALPVAVATARRWLQHDPLDEAACRATMQAYALAGDRSAALRVYDTCEAGLAAELDLAPDPATTLLAETIRRASAGAPQRARLAAPRGEAQPSLPFVGRADDYASLVAAYADAAGGALRAVVVAAEAGMGKTRLVDEFLNWAALQGADVLQGRAFEMGGQLPYQPIVMALRTRLEQENAPDDLLGDVWLAELSRLMPELLERYPDLSLSRVSTGGNEALAAARLYEAVARLGIALSRRRRLVLFLDDWQWADAASLDLLHYLGRSWAASRSSILLVLTVRFEDLSTNTELAHALANLERAVPLTYTWLYRLEEADVHAFVERWAGGAADSAAVSALSERLYRETAGIPFFLVETVKLLAEQVKLADGEGTIDPATVLRELAAGVSMPHSLRQAILIRLDKFDLTARSLLAAAAVLARNVRYEELCQVSGVDELAGLPALDALLAGQLLVATADARHPYTLVHDKIRDVVYTEAGHSRRRIYHRRAFHALQQAALPAAELAYHAEQAGLAAEARIQLQKAADEASQVFQNRSAVGFLSRALALTAPGEDADRYDLLLARHDIYHLLGDRAPQAADLAELDRLAAASGDLGQRAAVALRRARYAEATSDFVAAGQAATQAAGLARDVGDAELLARSTLARGNSLWRQRQFPPARRELHEAVALARAAALPQVEADSLRTLGIVAETAGDYSEAKQYYEQSLAMCRQIGNRLGEVSTLNNLGVVAYYVGDFSQARAYLEETLAIRRQLGDRRGEGHALYNIGYLASSQGSYDSAQYLTEQALAIFHETGDRWGEADALHSLGRVAADQRDYARAHGFYQQSLAICRDINHQRGEVLALRSLGHLLADQHQVQEARRYYELALPLAREFDLPGSGLECQAGLAEIAVAEGQMAFMLAAVADALDSLNDQALAQANEPFRVYLSCFRALRACQDQRENALLATAHQRLQERAAKLPDEASRQAFLHGIPSNSALLGEFEQSTITLAWQTRAQVRPQLPL
jgi:DNA-binding SARP family transcriptional activator